MLDVTVFVTAEAPPVLIFELGAQLKILFKSCWSWLVMFGPCRAGSQNGLLVPRAKSPSDQLPFSSRVVLLYFQT